MGSQDLVQWLITMEIWKVFVPFQDRVVGSLPNG